MRNAFSNALVKASQENPRVLLLTGDHGYALFDEFRKTSPEQYINAGVAEQNMVGVAAGLAKNGFKPFVYGLSAFIPIRVLEQIKIDVCYENLPVVLVGDGAGIVYSSLGFSHQSTEDISALRAIPNIAIFSPADDYEMTECMEMAIHAKHPVYLRIGKSDLGSLYHSKANLSLGSVSPLKEGAGDICFFATGSMVKPALNLSQAYPDSSLYSVPFIKPLNENQIVSLLKKHSQIITLEEHSIYGGLGSAIAEISTSTLPRRICRIGVKDRFSQYCGSYSYLIDEHKLGPNEIKLQIDKFLSKKA